MPLSKIEIADENVRKSGAELGLEELMHSIEKLDLIQPVIVIPIPNDKFKLIVGQRRFMAFRALGRSSIPAFVIRPMDPVTQKIVSLGENIHRSELPYNDTIDVCNTLFDEYTGSKSEKVRKISKDLGVSTSTILKYLAHRLVPKPVRDLVDGGKISADLAYRLTSSFWPDETKILAIAKKSTRLTKSESRRVAEIGKRKPHATVEEIIAEAKTPKPVYEIVIPIDPESAERLQKIAKRRKMDVKNLVLSLIESLLEKESVS